MAGKKNFINNTNELLWVSLSVRKGGNPDDDSTSQLLFPLPPNMSHEQEYGNDSDIFLNSIKWLSGDKTPLGEVVVGTRGDNSDNLMNMNSIITFRGEGNNIQGVGSNTVGTITYNGLNYSIQNGEIHEINAQGQRNRIGYGAKSVFSHGDTLVAVMPDGSSLKYNGIPNNWSPA